MPEPITINTVTAIPPLPRPLPPQPEPLPEPAALQPQPHLASSLQPWPPVRIRLRSVRCGCYLINYTPSASGLVTYDGTLRVECHSNGRTASGDLYQRRVMVLAPSLGVSGYPRLASGSSRVVLLSGPNPASGIPILARSRYRHYLSVTQILEHWTTGGGFSLGFDRWRFDLAARSWANEGSYTAAMSWVPAPAGYPSSGDYLEGDVRDSSGTVVGRLTMGWVSPYLRKATVEIDRVSQSEAPLSNGAGVNWKAIGDAIGWDISVDQSDSNVTEPSGESWSNAECHAAMLARRDTANLDAEWRYHVLCVRRLDATERGIMYDNGATDSNNVPREGCAISSHWVIPNTSDWGLVQGMRFGTAAAPYYRTAVHETGHAMGLYHNTVDNGFMNTTDVISASATATNPFPNNIQWSFAGDDQKRLRHMPDVYVRPGGTPFGTSYASTPISPADLLFDMAGLDLAVSPLLESVPLGAPVRVNLNLMAQSETPVEVPSRISLGSGFVRGDVTDPSGIVRTFSPLVLCVDQAPLKLLHTGESLADSLTLLRGAQGPLFPVAGPYTIRVEVHWDIGGVEVAVNGTTNVMVTAAEDAAHAEAALKVLSTPDTLLTLVLGGDHVREGIDAIQAALKNPILRPHYAHVEAKRVGTRFGKRKPDIKAAGDLLDAAAVLSPAEIKSAAGLVAVSGDSAAAKSLAKRLKSKVASEAVGDEVKAIVDKL